MVVVAGRVLNRRTFVTLQLLFPIPYKLRIYNLLMVWPVNGVSSRACEIVAQNLLVAQKLV